jgi:hypothetical protein
MGHPVEAEAVLSADKGNFTPIAAKRLSSDPRMRGMEGLFRFEIVVIVLALATVFLLVLVALARHDARS